MKRIVLVIMLSILVFSGCSKNGDELVMVTEAGFKPYEYYEGGEIVGVDVDIAEEIAKYLGKKLVVKDVAFDSIINELNSGKADFAAAGMSVTPERMEEVDFSLEYVVSNQLGSVADTYANKNFKNSEIISQKKYLTMIEDLKAGKVDLIIMDNLPAKEIIDENSELKILDGYLFSDSYGIAVKKGNSELLESINTVLSKLIDDGKIEEYVIKHSE